MPLASPNNKFHSLPKERTKPRGQPLLLVPSLLSPPQLSPTKLYSPRYKSQYKRPANGLFRKAREVNQNDPRETFLPASSKRSDLTNHLRSRPPRIQDNKHSPTENCEQPPITPRAQPLAIQRPGPLPMSSLSKIIFFGSDSALSQIRLEKNQISCEGKQHVQSLMEVISSQGSVQAQ